MGLKTPLFRKHVDAGARIVDFFGWDMPLAYGSQIREHNQVRTAAAMFDVSHMTVVDVSGADAQAFLRYLLSNDVARLATLGSALYSAMLNEQGGIVDDLIVYRMGFGYRLVVNCATRMKDLQWLARHSRGFRIAIEERPGLAILAVHGPHSIERLCQVMEADAAEQIQALGNFQGVELDDMFVARTGYTGEKGTELILPGEKAPALWERLLAAGVPPAGLGARDTLRLEAGMNLYGQDMDETTSPLASNMGFAIAWEPDEREFVGRAAVTQARQLQQQGKLPELVGLVLEQRGMLRQGQQVTTNRGEGVITTGGFSPSLKQSIALARIPPRSESCQVQVRGKPMNARIVKPRFVRFGRQVFE